MHFKTDYEPQSLECDGAAAQIREVRVIYNEELPWELLKAQLGSPSFTQSETG